GVAPFTWAVTSGALPPGLSLAGSTISGTPTTAGTYTFTLRATDANGCQGSRSYNWQVVCGTVTVSPSSLSNATIGVAYSKSFTATSGATAPVSWAVTAGALPAGLTLS